MSSLTKGRRVHYAYKGQCYIADVVQLFGSPNTANLVLTLDGSNDRIIGGRADVLQVWKTSVSQDDNKADSTWHWPERTD